MNPATGSRYLSTDLLEEVSGIRLVHELDDLLLVGGVDGRHRNVPHRPEIAAIIQVLVLKPEKVPDEPVNISIQRIAKKV